MAKMTVRNFQFPLILKFIAESSWKDLIYQIISKPASLLCDINNTEKDEKYDEENILVIFWSWYL